MLDFIETWLDGACYLFEEEMISFYAYFTTILTEIAILWRFFPEYVLPFTILLGACILNVIVCSYVKGNYEGTKVELVVARIYVGVFVAIFAIGFFFGWLQNIILFFVPFVVTFILVLARLAQIIGEESKINSRVFKIFNNELFRSIIQIIVILVPFEVFALFVFLTSLDFQIKVAIVFWYAVLVPLLSYMEDSFAACNIFETAYYVTWSKKFEEKMEESTRVFEKNQTEGFNGPISENNAVIGVLDELEKYDK